jgi:Na+/melibiose symporter-like transporter
MFCLYRSPLKIFITVCIACLFSTIVAGSGLYKAVSEEKYSALKNTQHNYDIIHTDDLEAEEETLQLQKSDGGDEESIAESSQPAPSWLRELFPNSATLFLCAVGFLASYGVGGLVTWSVIYYERYLGVSDTFNSLGYITFMVCMACGRFACDTLRYSIAAALAALIGSSLSAIGW